jgi:hypothetical protein
MRTPTLFAVAAALIAVAGCTPTTTTVRPVETAGTPATHLHVDVLTGTRAAPATLRGADTARAVVTAEAAPPSPEPTPHRPPTGRRPPLEHTLVPDELDLTGSDQSQDGPSAAGGWAPDGPEAAAAAELKRRFEAQGLTVLDLDVRPASRDDNGHDDGRGETVTRLEVFVVHTSGHSHPHQSVYLAALTDDDHGWQVLELQVQP